MEHWCKQVANSPSSVSICLLFFFLCELKFLRERERESSMHYCAKLIILEVEEKMRVKNVLCDLFLCDFLCVCMNESRVIFGCVKSVWFYSVRILLSNAHEITFKFTVSYEWKKLLELVITMSEKWFSWFWFCALRLCWLTMEFKFNVL